MSGPLSHGSLPGSEAGALRALPRREARSSDSPGPPDTLEGAAAAPVRDTGRKALTCASDFGDATCETAGQTPPVPAAVTGRVRSNLGTNRGDGSPLPTGWAWEEPARPAPSTGWRGSGVARGVDVASHSLGEGDFRRGDLVRGWLQASGGGRALRDLSSWARGDFQGGLRPAPAPSVLPGSLCLRRGSQAAPKQRRVHGHQGGVTVLPLSPGRWGASRVAVNACLSGAASAEDAGRA